VPAYHAHASEPERFRLAAAVDAVRMLTPLHPRLLASPPEPTTDTNVEETPHER
jgi:hypothetical protein